MDPHYFRDDRNAVLRVEDLVVEYKTRRGTVHAVSEVSFDVLAGETLAVVGESGSGKSTIAKTLVAMVQAAGGSVGFENEDLTRLSERELRKLRPLIQMIFQDPVASLNPRRVIEDLIAEGIDIWPELVETDRDSEVDALMREVGMNPDVVRGRRAGEFSGGQCQRIAIARALAMKPKLLICDEPVSALDVSVQAQILNLLRRMKENHDLTRVFISHDLSVVRNISDRVLVLYLGKICEIADADSFFARPTHPYSQLLLASVPGAAEATGAGGVASEQPSPLDPPSGCRFRTRCPLATDLCAEKEPLLRRTGTGHYTACHYADS
jgi:peptide/nickel transport system ATP-binding protein